jgi:hypothetical protein
VKKGSVFLLCWAVLASASLLFAGCGGGDESTTLTRAEFVQQVNNICKEAAAERRSLFQQEIAKLKPGEATLKDRETLIHNVFVVPYENTADQIESLGAPSGDEEKIQALIEAMEAASRKVEKKPQVALESTIQYAVPNKLAIDYGLKGCVL